MVRKIILASLLMPLCFNAQSTEKQRVGINTDSPNESAVLHIAPFKGEVAKVTASIGGGKVTGFTIVNPGKGYTVAPTVLIAGGGPSVKPGGVRATATSVIDREGKITAINIVNAGSGYETIPEVTLIPAESMGWTIPRVDLIDIYNSTYPVNIPNTEITNHNANGLLVFNNGSKPSNTNQNVPYWYDTKNRKWNEGVDANRTPKLAVFHLTGDENNLHNLAKYAGSHMPILRHKPFKEPISNINGIDFVRFHRGDFGFDTYVLELPRIQTTYTIEVTLNFNTTAHPGDLAYNSPSNCHIQDGINCSKAINSDGFQIMGYFLQIDTQYANTEYNTQTPPKAIRQEIPILSKINSPHSATWLIPITITPNSNSKPRLRFEIGRMDGSTHHQPANLLAEGSFIKVQQINQQ